MVCEFTYEDPLLYKQHQKSVHGFKHLYYPCHMCDHVAPRLQRLEVHVRKHGISVKHVRRKPKEEKLGCATNGDGAHDSSTKVGADEQPQGFGFESLVDNGFEQELIEDFPTPDNFLSMIKEGEQNGSIGPIDSKTEFKVGAGDVGVGGGGGGIAFKVEMEDQHELSDQGL